MNALEDIILKNIAIRIRYKAKIEENRRKVGIKLKDTNKVEIINKSKLILD